ncbi:MAG: tetratricopeptide repeat protein [Candidatus Marinimicrobia bacterium]|nr:tetratricopeptide repeat protein [Candidatus Neomarinimicrobiota bacterium]
MDKDATPTRKLAAIMFTDMVGYTALMQKDEDKARELIERHRAHMKPFVEKHGGEIIQYVGDGTFCRFDSAIEAVNTALEIQKVLELEPEINLRIGIHVGDVVVKGDEVYGDGVNVASRLEPLAPPRGICVSEKVYDEIKNQPGMVAVSLGRRRLKNVQRPVEVFALTGEGLPIPSVRRRFLQRPIVRRGFQSAAAVTVLAIIYVLVLRGREPAYGDVPSVGVLYLGNLGAPEDEYFSYGITEDLIIDLSKAGAIRVPSMKDVLPFKESEKSLLDIAKELRVRFVLTGSIRKEPGRFRLAAQLIEPASGRNLWSERWEEPLSEASAIKGKMIHEIIGAIGLAPDIPSVQEIQKKPTVNPDAYEFYLKGKYRYAHSERVEDVEVARGLLEKAIELDAGFLLPRIMLGRSYGRVGEYDRAIDIFDEALAVAKEKESLSGEAAALVGMGTVRWRRGEYEKALTYFTRSLEASRNIGDRLGEGKAFISKGNVYLHRGEYDNALDFYTQSLAIWRELGYRNGEAASLGNIGIVHKKRGGYRKAAQYYTSALIINQELGNRHEESITLINIAGIDLELGEYEKALELYSRSLAILQGLGNRQLEGIVLTNIGIVYFKRGYYDNALQQLTHSLDIAQGLGDREGMGWSQRYIGEVHFTRGEYSVAANHLRKSAEIFKSMGAMTYLLAPLSTLALSEARMGEHELTLETAYKLEKGIAAVEESAVDPLTLWNTSRAFELTGHREKAKDYLERAYEELTRRAEKLAAEEDSESFLTKVTENREIVAAWERAQEP